MTASSYQLTPSDLPLPVDPPRTTLLTPSHLFALDSFLLPTATFPRHPNRLPMSFLSCTPRTVYYEHMRRWQERTPEAFKMNGRKRASQCTESEQEQHRITHADHLTSGHVPVAPTPPLRRGVTPDKRSPSNPVGPVHGDRVDTTATVSTSRVPTCQAHFGSAVAAPPPTGVATPVRGRSGRRPLRLWG